MYRLRKKSVPKTTRLYVAVCYFCVVLMTMYVTFRVKIALEMCQFTGIAVTSLNMSFSQTKKTEM